ncbi:MAG: ferritin family protein [Phycisphaerae bacterium]
MEPASPAIPADLGPDKALAIGSYGESVAAYRYLIFAEKAATQRQRDLFASMADEEQSHKQRLQRLLAQLYPDADFVLSENDKALVVVGPRLLDVRDADSFSAALRLTLATEQRTATFYHALAQLIRTDPLHAVFKELAEEGAEHYQRLQTLFREADTSA